MKRKNSHKANPLASIPIIAMLAMAPLSTNGTAPSDNAHLTELVTTAYANTQKAYTVTQTPQKVNLSELKALEHKKLQKIIRCKGNDQNANILFTTIDVAESANSKGVRRVYYVEDSYQEPDRYGAEPPVVSELIYHDLGDKSFAGIKVYESIYTKTGEMKHLTYEVRLDDKSAQYIINFLAGETEFTNRTNIKFSETKSTKLLKPIVH